LCADIDKEVVWVDTGASGIFNNKAVIIGSNVPCYVANPVGGSTFNAKGASKVEPPCNVPHTVLNAHFAMAGRDF